jgi:hypothetical protein
MIKGNVQNPLASFGFKTAISVLPKAYIIGCIQSAVPLFVFLVANPSFLTSMFELYWSEVLLSGFWSVVGFLCAPYAIYQTFSFLPEQAELNGAAQCLQANSFYIFELDDHLSKINPLLAGAIYAIVTIVFLAWRLKKHLAWKSTILAWRSFFVALTIAVSVIWLKDSLARVIGVHNFYCG